MKKAILFFCLSLFFCCNSFAQILIDKSKEKHTVKPGDVVSGVIQVVNGGKADADVRIYFEDFRYQKPFDGAKEFLHPGTLPSSPSPWLSYAPQDVSLKPSGAQKVSYSFRVPADIKDGGYYGVLFFETLIANPSGKAMGPKISERIGCLFFFETEKKTKKTAIEAVNVNQGKLEADFTTASNVIIIPGGTYYMMSEDGMVAARGEIPKLYLPPQASAPFSIVLPVKNIADGNYSMVITFDLDDEDVLTKEIELSYKTGEGFKIVKIGE
jgi:hypothetical protein